MKQLPKRIRRYYNDATCKVDNCPKRPKSRGFCDTHSAAYRKGKLTFEGKAHPDYERQRRQYKKDWRCIVCGSEGPFSMGFCKRHYNQYNRGFYSIEGRPIKRRKKAQDYAPDAVCRVPTCKLRPKARGFCDSHYQAFKYTKSIDELGRRLIPEPFKNEGLPCDHEGCEEKATAKGYCQKHRNRQLRHGFVWADGKRPLMREQKCQIADCSNKARTKSYCVKHYLRSKRKLPLKDKDFYINSGKKCEYLLCSREAQVKGYCHKHYSRLLRDQPLNDYEFALAHRPHSVLPCQAPGCEAQARAKKLCNRHYQRAHKGQPLDDTVFSEELTKRNKTSKVGQRNQKLTGCRKGQG